MDQTRASSMDRSNLTDEGRAFQWTPCGRYAPQRLDFAIEAALCGWWLLDGWEQEDLEAVRQAMIRARPSAGES
jgi:hypothetical protein